MKYENPTNDDWTLKKSLEDGIYACTAMGGYYKSKTEFENELKLNSALDNLKTIESASQDEEDNLFLEKCKEYQASLAYLMFTKNKTLNSRIKKVEDTKAYIILKREVRDKISNFPKQVDEFGPVMS